MEKSFFDSPQWYRSQKTVKKAVSFDGFGLHSGIATHIKLLPAPVNHGIIFERCDLPNRPQIFAHYDAVVCTKMATSVGYGQDPNVRISTVEHLMAALFALGISNVLIEVRGSEIPILDGSAKPFIDGILEQGIEPQHYSCSVLKVKKPIKVYEGGAVCELLPRNSLRLTTTVDFAHPEVGMQTFAMDLTPQSFMQNICCARTFGFLKDAQALKERNLALGASLENVLAFSDEGILNPEGARFPDECARHKLLDAIGDLALCGSWIEGELVSFRGGHSIHLALLQALKGNREYWELIPAEPLNSFQPVQHEQPVPYLA